MHNKTPSRICCENYRNLRKVDQAAYSSMLDILEGNPGEQVRRNFIAVLLEHFLELEAAAQRRAETYIVTHGCKRERRTLEAILSRMNAQAA